MADLQLDPRPYFMMLHSLLRQGELDYDRERISKNIEWLLKNAAVVRKTSSTAEFGVLMTLYAFWDKHKEVPDRPQLEELVRLQQGHKLPPEGLIQVLQEYDKHEEDLVVKGPIDLMGFLDQRKEMTDQIKLSKVLALAQRINVGTSTPDPKAKDQTVYKGPEGALQYIHKRVTEGILIDDAPTQGGLLADTAAQIKARYDRTLADSKNNNLFIKTGIPAIDNQVGGLRRKEVNGLLGFTAQRKTGVVRYIAHTAATLGFDALYIPLESDYAEEENAQLGLHAGYCGHHGITKKAIECGQLSEIDRKLLDKVAETFEHSVAKHLRVLTPAQRSWADVRAIIEQEHHMSRVDLVIIDYMTLLSTPGNRDDVADKLSTIQDAKRLAMSLDISILTPVQGSRKGFDEASENDGVWSISGVFKYSELDKSLDNCFTVYASDEMMAQNLLKIGSCKMRRDAAIPATLVRIDAETGRVRPVDERVPVRPSGMVCPELEALMDKLQTLEPGL